MYLELREGEFKIGDRKLMATLQKVKSEFSKIVFVLERRKIKQQRSVVSFGV